MIFLHLFWEFFKTGLFAVGGGLATLPFLLNISQTRPEWFTAQELGNMVAVSESTPGPIGINMATYAGFNTQGILGSLTSTLALILPSVIIIMIVARAYAKFKENLLVQDMFHILRPVAVGMIFCALYALSSITLFSQGALQTIPCILFAVFFALCMFFKKLHPIVWIALGAVCGLVLL